MKILLLGSGAREHALARSLCLDPLVTELDAAPGNPGLAELTTLDGNPVTLHRVDIADPDDVADLAEALGAELLIIGPEVPLVAGVADEARRRGIPVFGPSAAAARLEGSKSFAKEIMEAAGVPTASAITCTSSDDLRDALERFGAPHVVKDDGLAAGKGVVVTDDFDDAMDHGLSVLAAGGTVVVEEFLDGPEVSLFCLCDGTTVVPLQPAQDFKRALDGDEGPNTGGMGAYSPLPWAPEGLVDEVVATVAQPTIDEMARRGTPFVGVLFCGLALTSKGLRVIEFNARFGDPETQVVLARLRTPLAELLLTAAVGDLDAEPALEWSDDAAVVVVVASNGYPADPRTGDVIHGLVIAEARPGVQVLQAGTATTEELLLVSDGGRVLSVVGTGPTLTHARDAAYGALGDIRLDGSHYRTDIALAASAAIAGDRA